MLPEKQVYHDNNKRVTLQPYEVMMYLRLPGRLPKRGGELGERLRNRGGSGGPGGSIGGERPRLQPPISAISRNRGSNGSYIGGNGGSGGGA